MRRSISKTKSSSHQLEKNKSLSHFKYSKVEGEYVTPEKFKKQIRQRTSEFNRTFPQCRELKCAIVNRVVGKLIKSPSTSRTMNSIMSRYIKVQPKRDNNDTRLVHTLMKIQKFRTCKNNTKLAESVNQLKETYSIRSAAKKLNMHYSELHRLLKSRKEHGRSLSSAAKNNVIKSYSSSSISLQLPFKKYAKFYYLRTSLAVAYDTYAREQIKLGCAVLSQSSVYRCIQGKFRIRKRIPFKDTQCADCVNNSLLVDALIVGKVKGVKRRITENVLNSYCEIEKVKNNEECSKNENTKSTSSRKLDFVSRPEVITDHKRDCIFRVCKKCSAMTLQESIIKQNPDISWNQEVTWHQWKNVIVGSATAGEGSDINRDLTKKRDARTGDDKIGIKNQEQKRKIIDKVRYRGTLAQLLSLFISSTSQMSVHLFHFRWQAFQFEECKKQLQVGDILFIMDFATNYSHHRQDEIHGAFWCRNQTTLHPIIIYYPCGEGCGHLVRDEVMVVSADLKHDSFAVSAFIDKALAHLKAKNIPVKRIIMWSDNCGPQYKSCKVFDSVSKQEIPVQRCYFCARHGKAEADGAIGRLSMHIDAVVRSGTHEFSDAGEIVRYCNLKLKVDKDKDGMCCHWQRHYFEVSDINRDDSTLCQTVKGTLSLHSVRNVGIPGIVEVRESSCFCEVCFHNESGVCKNSSLVQPFAWTSVYKHLKIEQNLQNKLWQGNSVQFQYIKKHMFRPKDWKKDSKQHSKRYSESDSKRDGKLINKMSNKKNQIKQPGQFDIELSSDDSSDTDYELDIPLIDIKEGLKGWYDSTPVSHRTRFRLSNTRKMVRCTNSATELDLNDYEETNDSDDDDIVPAKGECNYAKSNNTQKRTKLRVRGVANDDFSREISNCEQGILKTQLDVTSKVPKKTFVLPTSTPIRPLRAKCEVIQLSPIPVRLNVNQLQIAEDVPKSHDFEQAYDWNKLHDKMLGCKDFHELKSFIESKAEHIPALPDKYAGDMTKNGDLIDNLAFQLIPDDIPQRFRCHHPTTILADGNCFCRSISRLVFGTENEHLQIRCRLVVDMTMNLSLYTDNDYLMRNASHLHKRCSNIASYYCIYSGVKHIGNRDQTKEGIESVFKDDILRIRKLAKYCGPWQFHSAANVLNSKLTMVFPSKDIRNNVRADLNREFWPNNVSNVRDKELGLLWTKTCQIEGKPAEYNHIVPLISRYFYLYVYIYIGKQIYIIYV